MTRRSTLKLTLLQNVSGAALTVGVWTSPCRDAEISEAALSLLARFGIWLRLIFGLHSERYIIKAVVEPDYNSTRHQIRTEAHRRKRNITGRKHPAYDLEMLMHFAPGCRPGLTLNQYRDRFTRLSILGRVQIYSGFFKRLTRQLDHVLCRTAAQGGLYIGRNALCQAPLHPD